MKENEEMKINARGDHKEKQISLKRKTVHEKLVSAIHGGGKISSTKGGRGCIVSQSI